MGLLHVRMSDSMLLVSGFGTLFLLLNCLVQLLYGGFALWYYILFCQKITRYPIGELYFPLKGVLNDQFQINESVNQGLTPSVSSFGIFLLGKNLMAICPYFSVFHQTTLLLTTIKIL